MFSAGFGNLTVNILRPEMILLSWQWRNKPVTQQQALVVFYFAFDDSLAAREVAACALSQGLAHAPKVGHPALLITTVS